MICWQNYWSSIRQRWHWLASAGAAVLLVCGLWWHHFGLISGGAVLAVFLLGRAVGAGSNHGSEKVRPTRRLADLREESEHLTNTNVEEQDHSRTAESVPRSRARVINTPHNSDAFIDSLLATGRYALLLRPETKRHLSHVDVMRAVRRLDEAMALVPGGRVLLGTLAEQSGTLGNMAEMDPKLVQRNMVQVEPVYLDRYCVTNEEFQQFVDAGGYEQLELWHEESLPAMLDFVDQTGAPGPRFWSDGQYPSGEGRLPVVGVSWYEACAYARWVGKRLPTDGEWTKAGAWPVEAAPGRIAQRRYPWGESFDIRRAHLYGSGHPGPVAVDKYPGGMSVGGVHQLIGNVWEWTATPLAELGDKTLHVSESVMSIRGGAFDTYFENQATCHYQSGESALSRRPNIGFRLVLPIADLEPEAEDGTAVTTAEEMVGEPSVVEDAAATC